MNLFLDIAPVASGVGIVAGVVFFLVLAAAAFVAFKMLKRTVKMAFRIIIVTIILAVGVAGSIAFWVLGTGGKGPASGPVRNR